MTTLTQHLNYTRSRYGRVSRLDVLSWMRQHTREAFISYPGGLPGHLRGAREASPAEELEQDICAFEAWQRKEVSQ